MLQESFLSPRAILMRISMTNKVFFLKCGILILFLFSSFSCAESDRQLQEIQDKADSLSRELKRQQKLSDSLQAVLEKESEVDDFRIFYGKGYENIEAPEEYIKNELQKHKEKIPLDPVLGGTMEFREIRIISEDWLLAIYDDGHVQGKTIFKYELLSDGEMKFSPIVSDLPQ